jgi:hypothetical protein
MRAEAQYFSLDRLGIGSLRCFRRAERRQEYAEHIGALAAASGKFESKRLCSDQRISTWCEVGFLHFCSTLL